MFLPTKSPNARTLHNSDKQFHYCNTCLSTPTIHPTVPDAPEIVSADRISATDIQVIWTQLTFEESRGFLTSYSVAYSPSETTTCPEVDLETNTILTTSSEYSQLVISDLDPRLEYCVGIAASTVAGTGNYSATLKVQCKCTTDGIKLLAFLFICFAFFLVYNTNLFQLRFSGVDNCVDWVVSPNDINYDIVYYVLYMYAGTSHKAEPKLIGAWNITSAYSFLSLMSYKSW